MLPWARVPRVTNLTSLQQLMAAEGYSNKLDPTNTTLPFDVDIRIMERTKLKVATSASKSCIRRFVITEKPPTRAFSWLKAATTAFTFKTLLRHYAKLALTPLSLNVKLGPRRNYHDGRAAIRHYANQPARPL